MVCTIRKKIFITNYLIRFCFFGGKKKVLISSRYIHRAGIDFEKKKCLKSRFDFWLLSFCVCVWEGMGGGETTSLEVLFFFSDVWLAFPLSSLYICESSFFSKQTVRDMADGFDSCVCCYCCLKIPEFFFSALAFDNPNFDLIHTSHNNNKKKMFILLPLHLPQ